MIKASHSQLLPVYHKLFNTIFSQGDFPETWRLSTLTPLHKKGSIHEAQNYRGIAISSNLCKLFCGVLHKRLTNYSEEHNIIPPSQIGHKPKARTSDHVLTLKAIIDKYITRMGKSQFLFTCFVDFKSAFDTVTRRALLYKLLQLGIGGNFLQILQNMYTKVHYAVKLPDGLTDPIDSKVGVKQGCILSPTLFNIFIHDLPNIFDQTCDQVELNDINISCLMYADDLVLMSKSAQGLQMCLNKLNQYCDKWRLQVNLKKTKVMIFNKTGKLLQKYKFYYNNGPVEITNSYQYLGIIFTPSGSFTQAIKKLTDQALKALFKLRQQNLANNIPVALRHYKLFDTLIMPILSYCAEIWTPYFIKGLNADNFLALGDKLPLEKIHTKFCRFILGVNKKTTNIAVRAELGRRPILVDLVAHSAKYWMHLVTLNSDILVHKAYIDMLKSYSSAPNWVGHINNIWTTFNLAGVWVNQGTRYKHKVKRLLINNISDNHDRQWWDVMNKDDSKLRTYKDFKRSIYLENYLIGTMNVTRRKEFTKLRISAHQLRIETGRYSRPKTPLDKRICQLCNSQTTETELHFVLQCTQYNTERNNLIINLDSFTTFSSLTTDQDKMGFIMSYNNGDVEVARVVQDYINIITQKRKDKLST